MNLKETLQAFLNREVDFGTLTRVMDESIQADPAVKAKLDIVLTQLYRDKKLPPQLYHALMQAAAASVDRPQQAQSTQSATPATTGAAVDAAVSAVDSPITEATAGEEPVAAEPVSRQVSADNSAPEEPESEAALKEHSESSAQQEAVSDAEDEVESSDKTVINIPAVSEAALADADNDKTQISLTPIQRSEEPSSEVSDNSHNTGQSWPRGHTAEADSQPVSTPVSDVSAPATAGAHTTGSSTSGPTGATGSSYSGSSSGWSKPENWSGDEVPVGPGDLLKDRFVLETVVGRGGMGVVYRARDLRKEEAGDRNPYIAVKVLNEDFKRHPDALKALQREARKSQTLAHPNIVNVFDFDRDGGNIYMTMEFLEGKPLDKFIKSPERASHSEKDLLRMVAQMGNAIAYAHQKGVVHSDFKPGNIFLTKDLSIKVFDFGIARASQMGGQSEGEKTVFDAGTLGALTPAYASLEMLEGEEPDPKDDIYALACVAYELLTGKHPFNKTPANKAKFQELVPPVIKSLSRRQMRGLNRALEFERARRTPSVQMFLEEIEFRPFNKMMAAGVAAGVILTIGSAVKFIPEYLKGREIESLIASIQSQDNELVYESIARISEFSPVDAQMIKNTAKEAIIDFYRRAIYAEVDHDRGLYNYDEAERLIGEALTLYSDSAKLTNIQESLEEQKNRLLADIDSQFNLYLASGRLLKDGTRANMQALLSIIEQLDENHPLLTDGRLPEAYLRVSARALEEADFAQAQEVISVGLALFPQDAALINMDDRIRIEQKRAENRERVELLAGTITNILEGVQSLKDFTDLRQVMSELMVLAPEHEALRTAQTKLVAVLTNENKALIETRSWDLAAKQITDFEAALPAEDVQSQRLALVDAQKFFQSKVDNLMSSLNGAVNSGNIDSSDDSATAILEKLKDTGADQFTLNRASSSIAQGYLTLSREARSRQDWLAAIDNIEKGRQFGVSESLVKQFSLEQKEVVQARLLQERKLADAERARIEQERKERADGLRSDITQTLQAASFDIPQAKSALQSLEELATVSPGDELVSTGRKKIAERVSADARAMGARGEWSLAAERVRDALVLLPESKELVDVQSWLDEGLKEQLIAEAKQNVQDALANIESMLANPAFTPAWESRLTNELIKIEGRKILSVDKVESILEQIAVVYVNQSQQMRLEKRFSEARQLIASGRKIAPSNLYDSELKMLASAEQKFAQEAKEASRIANIEGLKKTFNAQTRALALDDAQNTLAQLREFIPRDEFVTQSADKKLGDAYVKLASRQADQSHFTRAIKTVDKGLQVVGNYKPLMDIKSELENARDVDNVRANLEGPLPLNTQRVSALTRKIRSRTGKEYADYERYFADIVGKRVNFIAQSDKAKAAEFLASAQVIFPDISSDVLSGTKRTAEVKPSPAPKPAPRPKEAAPTQAAAKPVAKPQVASKGSSTRPAVNPRACSAKLAGYGRRSRAVCYDFLDSERKGPLMVVIPSGGGQNQPYAISKFEISVEDFNNFCELSASCSPVPGDASLPVTSISLAQAKSYANWLSNVTGGSYRIPTTDEWLHAATAKGGVSADGINCEVRVGGTLIKGVSLVEIRSGKPNNWGVVNFLGNAQEWVVDSDKVTVRGGAYNEKLVNCELSFARKHDGSSDPVTGMRLVRAIDEG